MGAGYGYQQAGFHVTGVDHKPQPNTPPDAKFIQANVMEVITDRNFMSQFDGVHASPPCQGYSDHTKDDSQYVHYSQGKQTPRLIAPVREALIALGISYVIENVRGARKELINPIEINGYALGLPIQRKRYFESNVPLITPSLPSQYVTAKQWAARNGVEYRDMSVTGKSRRAGSIETWKTLTGNFWMARAHELAESIPWIYTKWIGDQLMTYLTSGQEFTRMQPTLFP